MSVKKKHIASDQRTHQESSPRKKLAALLVASFHSHDRRRHRPNRTDRRRTDLNRRARTTRRDATRRDANERTRPTPLRRSRGNGGRTWTGAARSTRRVARVMTGAACVTGEGLRMKDAEVVEVVEDGGVAFFGGSSLKGTTWKLIEVWMLEFDCSSHCVELTTGNSLWGAKRRNRLEIIAVFPAALQFSLRRSGTQE